MEGYLVHRFMVMLGRVRSDFFHGRVRSCRQVGLSRVQWGPRSGQSRPQVQLEATSSVTSSLDKKMMKRKNHSPRITILELVQIGKAFQKKSNEAMDTGHCLDRESSLLYVSWPLFGQLQVGGRLMSYILTSCRRKNKIDDRDIDQFLQILTTFCKDLKSIASLLCNVLNHAHRLK